MNIAEVIGWKFNHQPGMRCREDEGGVLQIIDFPGGIPSKADQDLWTTEYEAHIAANPPAAPISANELLDLLVSRGILHAADRPTRP